MGLLNDISFSKPHRPNYFRRVMSDFGTLSIYWIALFIVFLFVSITTDRYWDLLFVIPTVVALLSLLSSFYYQRHYIKEVTITGDRVFAKTYNLSTEVIVDEPLSNIHVSMERDNLSKYGKSFLLLCAAHWKIKQYPRLDWTASELQQIQSSLSNDNKQTSR